MQYSLLLSTIATSLAAFDLRSLLGLLPKGLPAVDVRLLSAPVAEVEAGDNLG